MASTDSPGKGRSSDLEGIRQRGDRYQVRVFAGWDPVTGKRIDLTGSAATERAALRLRDKLRTEVANASSARTNSTLAHLVSEWLATHDAEETTLANYRWLADSFVIPVMGDVPLAKVIRLGTKPFEQLYADLRTCRRRCKGAALVDHRTTRAHKCDGRCRPHECSPLAPTTIRKIHAVLSGAFTAAVRWGWVGVNPMDSVIQPRAPKPQPTPPSTEQAARIVDAAWKQDDDWGTFVWLTFVTGARRGELVALTWNDLDLTAGVLSIRRGLIRRSGRTRIKDTKSHQMRRISLDKVTVALLKEHHARWECRCSAIGADCPDTAYVFSYAADNSRPCNPDTMTHRYSTMTAALGLDTHLHELRHYSATELLSAGVDLRTVAGRLGHGGGGATTLKVYAAWVQAADEQAAELLASRLPSPAPRRSEEP
jgi:integrase